MPELPEVETIARILRQGGPGTEPVTGRIIQSTDVFWDRTIAAPATEEFQKALPGRCIKTVDRRGKYLVITLDRGALLIHLKMSGDLRVEPAVDVNGHAFPPVLHDRVMVIFKDGMRLVFNDARKFGRMWLVDDQQEITGRLGPDPLKDSFSPEQLFTRLKERQRQLKPLLLDQGFIAGLGNIYTDEALHLAGLHPLILSNQVSRAEAGKLWTAIRQVLEEGIRTNGASIDWVYRGGEFQNHFRVYRRTGQPCPTCGNPVQRMVVGQRGTHYCPVCQPLQENFHVQ